MLDMERVDKWIDEHKQQIVDELCAWIRIRSVSDETEAQPGQPFGPGCAQMLEYALASAREKGFKTENHDGYAGSVYMGEQTAGEIGIVAHLDVVPEGNDWVHDPFKGEVIGASGTFPGYIVGRGSSDNKGMGVMGLYAMMCARDLELPLKHRLRLLLGTSEETGMSDMKHMTDLAAKEGSGVTLPDVTLVPDAGFPVCYGQKGRMVVEILLECGDDLLAFEGGSVPNAVPDRALAVLRDLDDMTIEELRLDQEVERINHGVVIRSQGKAAHAAAPENGINAIGVLARALLETGRLTPETRRAMRAIKKLLSDNYGEGAGIACEDEQSGKLTFACGMARFNAGRITLTMDCRFPVTTDINDMRARLCVNLAGMGAVIKHIDISPAFYMEESDPRIQALTQAYREITGDTESKNYTMGGGTYSKDLPCAITFGGGFPNDDPVPDGLLPEGHGGAHSPDEIASIKSLLKTLKVYVYAISKLDDVI